MYIIMREKDGNRDFLKSYKAGREEYGTQQEAKTFPTKVIAELAKEVLRQRNSKLTIEEAD